MYNKENQDKKLNQKVIWLAGRDDTQFWYQY